MKNLLFGLIATVLFSLSGNAQNKDRLLEIGTLIGDTFKLNSENLGKVKEIWKGVLNKNQVDVEIVDYQIIFDNFEDDKELSFYIMGFSADKSFKMASKLVFGDTTHSLSVDLDHGSVTCAGGCGTGCHPKYDKKNGFWYCNFPCSGGCQKTETISY